jgi:hypothetical protein
MKSNTAAVANQPINLPNFSVENKAYKADPFTIREGRYVGHDGFVVPRNFEEFYEQFPHYVRNWVNRHVGGSAPKEDMEDWTQDLLTHLLHLPSTSKHRETGKKDIVQTFDPQKHFGANQARFQNYINLCLTNKFRTLHSQRMKDALSQPRNVSLETQRERGDFGSVDDEFCHAHSEFLREAVNASEKQDRDRAFIREFMDFVRREDPNSVAAIEALFAAGTQGAGEFLVMTETQLTRTRNRLRQLGRCFLDREPVPKQRKPYKSRVDRNQTAALSERSVPPVTRLLLGHKIDPRKGGDDCDQTFAGAVLSESTQLGSLTVGG